ncbi:MAG: hypothetical protein RLZ44_378 [Pseudomonadota bacterium]
MTTFPYAHVAAPDWRSACDAVGAALGPVPGGGALGFVYAHHSLAGDMERIVEDLRHRTGLAHWVGTVGLGVCSTGREAYDEPTLAVLATDIPAVACHLLPPMLDDVAEPLAATADWRDRHDARFAVVHGDPSNNQLPQLITALADGLGHGYLVGGLTSSEGMQVQVADRAVGGGLSGVLLGAEVPVATGLSQGCSLIGRKHEITQCQRNILVELDGRPALDVLKEDIGEVLARDLRRIGGYIFAALPIAGSDTGDYLVRNLIGVDPDQGLIAVGDLLQPGTSLQFAKRDAQTARADLERMVDKLRERLPGEPKGALYHSCLGRGRHLFGDNSAELQLLREHLGDVPLVGFYANGEISHRRLYGYTGVLTVFC